MGPESLRFETAIYRGDVLAFRRPDEQAAPDRARRVVKDLLRDTTSESIAIGRLIRQRENGGEWHRSNFRAKPPFQYPQTWSDEHADLDGFAFSGTDVIEDHEATILRNWHEDPEREPNAYNEEIIWIDNETQRILRWDVHMYDVTGARAHRAFGEQHLAVRRGGEHRMIPLFRSLTVALGLLVLLLSACANGEDETTSTPSGNVPTSVVTTGPPAIIDGRQFLSVAREYRVQVPEDWQPDENFAVTPAFVVDAFLGPEDGTGVQPNISVTCVPAEDTSELEFLAAKRQFAERFAIGGVVQESTAGLGGADALQLEYEQATGSGEIRKIEIHQFSHGCAWSVVLTSAASEDYEETFRKFVDSFEFTGSSAQS